MNARDGFRTAIEMMQQSARLMGGFLPGTSRLCDWRELDHKFEAFRLFQYADRELKRPVDHLPLDETVQAALVLDPFRAIWILEGVGYRKAAAASFSVEGLLTDGPAAAVPDRALISLHAGMGTAFGEKLLSALGANPSKAEIAAAVDRFLDLCRSNCRPGWDDACIEPLGLVVRCLHPSLMDPVCRAMSQHGAAMRALFWHGVGRSLYFVPTNFMPLPGSQERMVTSAAAEAGSPEDRRQVLAGLIWAITLVNLPQPAVVRSLAALSSRLRIQAEFTNGLISALLAWRHMAPGDRRHLPTYTRSLPPHHKDAALWKSAIETPACEALEKIWPGLERRNQIPALYTYRTTEELMTLSSVLTEEPV